MKKISIILTTLILLTACTAQDNQEDLLMQIASSQEYAKYSQTIYGGADLIAQDMIDWNGIRLIFEMNPNAENLEAFSKEAFSQVKGGIMWYEYTLEFQERIKELDVKYSFRSLSNEQRLEISRLYEQITDGAERKKARDNAFKYLQNRQK